MTTQSLTGRQIDQTYKDLLQVGNSNAGIDGTLRSVADGEGTESALQVSTTAAKVVGDLTVTGTVTAVALGGNGARITTGRPGIMIPYYLYPNNPYTDATFRGLLALIRRYHDVPVIVILNPSSGPGSVWDGNYAAAIRLLKAAGATVSGYVSTAYGVRAEADVQADIDGWLSLYADDRIDSLFLDEQPWTVTADHIALYQRYRSYAHALALYPVIANPGTNQQGAWFENQTADIIIVHENSTWPSPTDMEGNYTGGHVDYPYTLRAALVYGQSSLDPDQVRELTRYVQWLYITGDTLSPNPWDSLSTLLEDQLYILARDALGGDLSGTTSAATVTKIQGIPVSTTDPTSNQVLRYDGSAYAPATLASVDLSPYAPLASPTFTGTPAAPTATAGTNTTQLATTAFVKTAVDNLVASAPGALDTLDELAAALGDDANYAATVTSALALKAPLASPTFTGTPAAPTAIAGTSTTQLATTAFVTTADALKAPLASPTFTGTVTAANLTVSGTLSATFAHDLAAFYPGVLANSAVVLRHVAVRAWSLPTNAAGSALSAGTAATGSTTLTLKKNGSSIGTAVVSASGTTASFTVTATSFAATDVLTIEGPATADSTLANVAISLLGTR